MARDDLPEDVDPVVSDVVDQVVGRQQRPKGWWASLDKLTVAMVGLALVGSLLATGVAEYYGIRANQVLDNQKAIVACQAVINKGLQDAAASDRKANDELFDAILGKHPPSSRAELNVIYNHYKATRAANDAKRVRLNGIC